MNKYLKNSLIATWVVFTLFNYSCMAQSKADLGLAIGAGYYMGDINPNRIFYSPGIDLGITYRYNINQRHVFKFEANYVRVSARDIDFNDDYQQFRNASFATPVFDFAAQFEFNFLPIKFAERKMNFTPFISTGMAADVATRSAVKAIMVSWPFAFGARTTIGKFWSIGIQWNYRKLFNDLIDGQENQVPNSMKSIIHNNDWISFANIFVTYKLFTTKQECPAYKKE